MPNMNDASQMLCSGTSGTLAVAQPLSVSPLLSSYNLRPRSSVACSFKNNIYVIITNTDFSVNNLIEAATYSHCLAHVWLLLEFTNGSE